MIHLTNIVSIKEAKNEDPNVREIAIEDMKEAYKIIWEA
jgi:hypothetical protein